MTESQHGTYNSAVFFTTLCNPGTKPTLPELLKFTCTDGGVISIPVQIATKYVQFGALLLDDRDGARVRIMEHKHLNNSEQINTEILREWLTGSGKLPVEWVTLVEVLNDIQLSILAGEITTSKCRSNKWIACDHLCVVVLCAMWPVYILCILSICGFNHTCNVWFPFYFAAYATNTCINMIHTNTSQLCSYLVLPFVTQTPICYYCRFSFGFFSPCRFFTSLIFCVGFFPRSG